MQRNGLIGQEFVCVKTERWYIGKTHTHTRTRWRSVHQGQYSWGEQASLTQNHLPQGKASWGFIFSGESVQPHSGRPHNRTYAPTVHCVHFTRMNTHTGTNILFYEVISTCFRSNQTNVYLPVFVFCSVFYHPTGQTQMIPHPSTIR